MALSKPQYLEIFKEAKQGSGSLGVRRLEKLVHEKQGFKLFQILEQIKIDLSSTYYRKLAFFDDDLKIREYFLRTHFEDLIREEIQLIDTAVSEVMKKKRFAR